MPHYKNFRAVVYCTAQSMVRISPEGLQRQIDFFQKYVGVDKVYLEPYRDDCLIPREQLHMCKELFRKNGIEGAGGITRTPGASACSTPTASATSGCAIT